MTIRRVVLTALLVVAGAFASVPAQEPPQVSPSLFAGMKWRSHRPAPRQPDGRRRRPPQPAVHLLHGRGERRRLEDDRRRADVGADLRRPADRIDRLDRGRAVRPERRSTSAAAKGCTGRTSRRVTASTSPPTRDGPGRASASATRSRFRASTSTRATRTACSSPRSAIRTGRTRSGASSDRSTAAARSRRCSTRTRTRAATTSTSTRSTPTSCTPRCGRSGRARGRTRCGPGTGGGIFKSTDGGTTWKPLTNGLPAGGPGQPGHLARRTRSGSTRPSRSPNEPGSSGNRGATGIFRSDDAGEIVDAHHDRHEAVRPDRRRRSADAAARSEEPRRDHHGQHRVVEVDRRRQDVGAVQGRAGRRGLPERLDQPGQPRHHPAGGRPGRRRHAERRQDVEFLVQPADRAALSRRCRQRVPVPRLQRAAGERVGVRREPRQLRRDFRSRLAAGRRGRVRLRRAGPAQPRHRLRRPERHAVRSPHRPGVERRPGWRARRRGRAATPGPVRPVRTMPVVFSQVDKRSLFFANNYLWKTMDGGTSWKRISPDLTRADVGDAEERRQVPRRPGREAAAARRHLHHRAVLPGHQPHLGRHRRRARST